MATAGAPGERRLSHDLGAVAENMSARIIEKHEGASIGEACVCISPKDRALITHCRRLPSS